MGRALAQFVRGFSPSQLLLLNPPDGMASGDGMSVLVSEVAPFAQASIDAVALDGPVSDALFTSVRASLRRGARVLAPVAMPIPDGFTELARATARLGRAASMTRPSSTHDRSCRPDACHPDGCLATHQDDSSSDSGAVAVVR